MKKIIVLVLMAIIALVGFNACSDNKVEYIEGETISEYTETEYWFGIPVEHVTKISECTIIEDWVRKDSFFFLD